MISLVLKYLSIKKGSHFVTPSYCTKTPQLDWGLSFILIFNLLHIFFNNLFEFPDYMTAVV